MPETLEYFYATTVRPSIDCEPGHGLKETYLNQLLNFLANDGNTSSKDLDIVRSICTGKIQRHPALHGVPGFYFEICFVYSGTTSNDYE